MASPQDVGGRVYFQDSGSASYDYTPYQPLANIVDKLVVTNLSTDDIIAISVNEKVLWRVPVFAHSLNRILDDSPTNFPEQDNFFDWFKDAFGYQLTFPVAQSFVFNVRTEGGATFDLYLEAMEVLAGVVTPQMINDPRSNRYVLPVFGSIAAAITKNGPNNIDTFVAPNYIPEVFLPTKQPGGYVTRLLALWADAFGINTFNGGADDQSTVQYLRIAKNGQPMYTRTNKGIPNVGSPSATGSLNAVYKGELQRYPPFLLCKDYESSVLAPPLEFMQGDTIEFALAFNGAYAGTPDYSEMLLVGLLDVQYTNS